MKDKPISLWSKLVAAGIAGPISPKIYCSEIFENYREMNRPDFQKLTNCDPPFNKFWLEGRMPRGSLLGFFIEAWRPNKDVPAASLLAKLFQQYMALVRLRDTLLFKRMNSELLENELRVKDLMSTLCIALAKHPNICREAMEIINQYNPTEQMLPGLPREEAGMVFSEEWIISAFVFYQRKHEPPSELGEVTYTLDENGSIPPDNRFTVSVPQALFTEDDDEIRDMIDGSVALCSYAMSIMNCKNIFLEDIDTQPSKRHRRMSPVKKIIFKILTIDPMSQKRRKRKGSQLNGTREKLTRLHVCRGHRADYRKGKGLYGRLNGVFFIPPHVRGTMKHGMVIKDYEIDPGAEGE